MAQITYVANYNEDYEQYQCRFFKSPKDAETWASTYEDFYGEFKFGSAILISETGEQVVSGTARYSKGLMVAIMGSPWETSFAEQFTIEDISREDLLSALKELSFDNEDSSVLDATHTTGAFYSKAVPGNGDDADWGLYDRGTEFNNGKKDFDFYFREGSGEINYNSGKPEQIGESVKTLKNIKLFEEFIKINN